MKAQAAESNKQKTESNGELVTKVERDADKMNQS